MPSPATKRAPRRKPETTNEVLDGVQDNATPMVVLPPSTAAALSDTVCLFELDGRKFMVPARPRAVIAVRYLFNVRRHGTEVATAGLLEELLGVDGFEALANYEDLEADQFKAVLQAANKLTMGSFEEAMGNGDGSSK